MGVWDIHLESPGTWTPGCLTASDLPGNQLGDLLHQRIGVTQSERLLVGVGETLLHFGQNGSPRSGVILNFLVVVDLIVVGLVLKSSWMENGCFLSQANPSQYSPDFLVSFP